MKSALFLQIKTAISLIFGLGFLLLTTTVDSWWGMDFDPAGAGMARLFGVVLCGIGLICFFMSSADDSKLRRDLLLSLFITDTLGFVVTLILQLGGVFNALGWLNVAIWLLLALGLAYFRFVKPAD